MLKTRREGITCVQKEKKIRWKDGVTYCKQTIEIHASKITQAAGRKGRETKHT
jgi:hypothetical protein